MHRGHNVTRVRANHRKAKNVVVILTDQGLHEAPSLVDRLGSQNRVHRDPRNARTDALALRFAFAQSHVGEWRICEHTIGNEPIARATVLTREIVANDAKVVFGYVRELRAARTFSNGPDLRSTRLQPLIHANVAATIQLNAGLLKSDSGGVRNPPRRGQYVAASDRLLAGWRTYNEADFFSRLTAHLDKLRFHENLNTFATENELHLLRNVDILPTHQLMAGLDD